MEYLRQSETFLAMHIDQYLASWQSSASSFWGFYCRTICLAEANFYNICTMKSRGGLDRSEQNVFCQKFWHKLDRISATPLIPGTILPAAFEDLFLFSRAWSRDGGGGYWMKNGRVKKTRNKTTKKMFRDTGQNGLWVPVSTVSKGGESPNFFFFSPLFLPPSGTPPWFAPRRTWSYLAHFVPPPPRVGARISHKSPPFPTIPPTISDSRFEFHQVPPRRALGQDMPFPSWKHTCRNFAWKWPSYQSRVLVFWWGGPRRFRYTLQ